MGGGASLVGVGGLAWCLGVAGSGWEWLGVAGSGLGSLGGLGRGWSGGRRGRSLRGGLLYWGFSLFWGLAWGEKWDNGAFWKGCRGARASGNGGWEWVGGVGGWRWDDFTGVG